MKHLNYLLLVGGFSACFSLTAFPNAVFGNDAKAFHAKGVKHFENNEFLEAAKAFREANRLRPTWRLQYNIGQCEASLKRYGLALEAFEAYLMGGG